MEEFELEPGEHIVKEVRQHPFVLALQLIPLVLLAFLPWFISGLISFLGAVSPDLVAAFAELRIPGNLERFATGLWLLGVWIAIFSLLTRYYLTVWVVTNIRIVDIQQWTFFSRQVSSFLLIRVQDMTTHVSGLIATIVGFGTLQVETAGSDEKFQMRGIARPEAIRDVIMSQVAQLHHEEKLGGGI
jgi:uncharacterized membrane protein YdbT with pleckstrin-like domain